MDAETDLFEFTVSLRTVVNTALHASASTLASLNYDADDDILTITAVSGASTNGPSGNVTLSGGNVNYTPATGFVGADQFTYTVSDGYTDGTATCTKQSEVRRYRALSSSSRSTTAPRRHPAAPFKDC